MRRVLFATRNCYLDDSNGAAVASRAMMEALARLGFSVEAITGSLLELGGELDFESWIAGRVDAIVGRGGESWSFDARGLRPAVPPHHRATIRGVPVTIHRGATSGPGEADEEEAEGFLRLFEDVLLRFRPDVLVTYGGDWLARAIRDRARSRGVAIVFALHNFLYRDPGMFAEIDAVVVPSAFAAEYYRRALGLDCTVLPCLLDVERARAPRREPKFASFVNPSPEKGVYAFARIADELGRLRPDIPLLVVEGRGTERTLVDCGLDLRVHGNISVMGNTPDPRHFWGVTRVVLMPSLWWENQPLAAIEAMANGIPVIGSDRGGIPETLGDSGIILPLPERLTPTSRILPTAADVAPWVAAMTRLWDDAAEYSRHSGLAMSEAGRWRADIVAPQYERFFADVRAKGRKPSA